jgi:hypothetical protein
MPDWWLCWSFHIFIFNATNLLIHSLFRQNERYFMGTIFLWKVTKWTAQMIIFAKGFEYSEKWKKSKKSKSMSSNTKSVEVQLWWLHSLLRSCKVQCSSTSFQLLGTYLVFSYVAYQCFWVFNFTQCTASVKGIHVFHSLRRFHIFKYEVCCQRIIEFGLSNIL